MLTDEQRTRLLAALPADDRAFYDLLLAAELSPRIVAAVDTSLSLQCNRDVTVRRGPRRRRWPGPGGAVLFAAALGGAGWTAAVAAVLIATR